MKGRMRLALAGLLALAVAAGTAALTGGASATPPDLLQAAKAAAAKYNSVEQAEKAGYALASPCVESPAGGMGFHYANAALMADDAIDPVRPEILVYAPTPKRQARARRGRVLEAGRRRQPDDQRRQAGPVYGAAVRRADAGAQPGHAGALRPARLALRAEPERPLRAVQPGDRLLTVR